jgi:hypothetical protein
LSTADYNGKVGNSGVLVLLYGKPTTGLAYSISHKFTVELINMLKGGSS